MADDIYVFVGAVAEGFATEHCGVYSSSLEHRIYLYYPAVTTPLDERFGVFFFGFGFCLRVAALSGLDKTRTPALAISLSGGGAHQETGGGPF